jgi:FAD/FMN-containing dehydrogenase
MMASDTQVQQLRSTLRGPSFTPADDGYDQTRAVYNAMIDRRPALIVQCVDVADVISAVKFGRDAGLAVAVRGGGHSGPGLGVCDGGLVIDLARMRGTRVDPAARTVRAEGGCTWGDVDHATHPFGLATPGGMLSTTGVGGLTLGGGVGYLTRAHGLTIDNLLSVDLVLADGRFVTASADQNPDLFWAVRGGGGNFGVGTSFEFRLHPISTVYGGPMLWPLARAAELLKFWRDLILSAPEELAGAFALLTVPPVPPFPEEWRLKKMCGIIWCYTGPLDRAEATFKPIRAFGPPAVDFAGPLPWPVLQTLFDPLLPPGLHWYWKSDFFTDLSDEAIALHVKHRAEMPTPLSTMHIYAVNGAAHRPGKRDTAFSFRDANFIQMIAAVDSTSANNERMIAWAKGYWQALHPHSAGAGYVNMIMDEGQDQVRAAYRENYDRLVTVKNTYDPGNLFRVNQNIRPAV